MKNITELRNELIRTIEEVRKDRRFVPQACEITNAAGKVIQSCKIELDYFHARKETPLIEFLQSK